MQKVDDVIIQSAVQVQVKQLKISCECLMNGTGAVGRECSLLSVKKACICKSSMGESSLVRGLSKGGM